MVSSGVDDVVIRASHVSHRQLLARAAIAILRTVAAAIIRFAYFNDLPAPDGAKEFRRARISALLLVGDSSSSDNIPAYMSYFL
jgi:hypothetical protein